MAPPVSPASRERVIALLTDRYAQDHLTLDEFERRAAAAYAARTPDELGALTADLGATEVPATRASLPAMNVGVVLGSIVREMHAVPRALEVRTVLGNVELDLTHASFAPGVTEISLHAFMGNIEIQLPSNVGVEDHVSAVLGSFEYRRHPRATSWTEAHHVTSVVRFTGRVTMSSAEVVIRKDRDSGEHRVEG
ncbi:MAG TPA: DUF1707 domain-containing protein [Gemmatimonadaceae bacterium]|nr:DUF1707 domain-containing protein [Gemmatimonadaceae bacterium]